MQSTDKKNDQTKPKINPSIVKGFYSPSIPKVFQLGGLKIDVLFQKPVAEVPGMLGAAVYATQQILLDPTIASQQTVEQAYLHELTHWILFTMGERELCSNEKFVDVFAHFLYQAMTTTEPYPPPTEKDEDEDSDDIDFEGIAFSDEESCERFDYMEEDAAEEEHYLACQEAGFEDVAAYQDGMVLSDDEGWFYGDD